MAMKKIKGRNLLLFSGGKAIAGNIQCELSMDADIIEVTPTTQATWREYITKCKGWKVASSHLLIMDSDNADNANNTMFTSLLGSKVLLSFSTTADSDSAREPSSRSTNSELSLQGYAICTAVSISAKNGEHVNGSFEFQGTGALS